MAGELQGVRSKLERAIKHRSDMQTIVVEFAESDVFEIRPQSTGGVAESRSPPPSRRVRGVFDSQPCASSTMQTSPTAR